MVVFAAVALYLPTARYGFVQDDRAIIVSNPAAHSIPAALRAFDDPYWPRASGGGLYRPLTVLTYAVDWTISGGRPGWLHVANALWHGAATLLVLFVAARWLGPVAAGAAALVFAWHPVHVEAVAGLVGRAELLAAVGVLGAVLAARRRRWALAVAAAAAAMLSKEHGVVVGVVILLDDWLASRGSVSYPRPFYGALAVTTLAYAAAWLSIGGAATGDVAPPLLGATLGKRLAMALPAVLRAAHLLVWPGALASDYNPRVIPYRTGVSLAALGGALVVAGIVWLVWWGRKRWPAASFAAGAAALAYLPTSNLLFPSGVLLAERALYLPVLLVAMAAGLGATGLATLRGGRVALAAVVILAAALGGRSFTRLPAWRDNRAVLLTLLADHPEAYRAHASAGAVLAGMADTAGARRELAMADSLFAGDPELAAARAFLLLNLGDTVGVAHLVARARDARPYGAIALRSQFLLAVARSDTAGARAVADTASQRRPLERRWYLIDSQKVVRVLRPTG